MTTISGLAGSRNLQEGTMHWVRSKEGWIAGVCEGLGERFGVSPNLLRLIWLLTVFAFGTGILVYILMAFSLPREDELDERLQPKFLGVCSRISQKTNIEVGLVRFLTLFVGIGSMGLTIIAYFILNLVLSNN